MDDAGVDASALDTRDAALDYLRPVMCWWGAAV